MLLVLGNFFLGYNAPTTPSRDHTRRISSNDAHLAAVAMGASHFCVAWEADMDLWWTHNPDWEVDVETDTSFCFSKLANDTLKSQFLRTVYELQFSPDPNYSAVYTKLQFNAGWGISAEKLVDRLLYGYQQNRPFQIANNRWKYAMDGNNTNPVCPSANIFCYFLPLGRCEAGEPFNPKINNDDADHSTANAQLRLIWLEQYALRPQQWLRRRLYEYMKANAPHQVSTPCVAIHVRRSDVVLDGNPRKYFPISDYLERVPGLLSAGTGNILLFTDDANAIDEAHELYPEYNWMFVNRTRYRGMSGKWGVHMPTNDPVMEVVAIHDVLRLAKHCDILVHSYSSFARVIYAEMLSTGRNITRIQIDSESVTSRYHANNSNSAHTLASRLEERRKSKGITGESS